MFQTSVFSCTLTAFKCVMLHAPRDFCHLHTIEPSSILSTSLYVCFVFYNIERKQTNPYFFAARYSKLSDHKQMNMFYERSVFISLIPNQMNLKGQFTLKVIFSVQTCMTYFVRTRKEYIVIYKLVTKQQSHIDFQCFDTKLF